MKPIVAIGDIHGLNCWRKIAEEHSGCRIVFLGDYLDPYAYMSRKDLLANLREIIALKASRPDDVVLLLGNHDLHYFCGEAPVATRFDAQMKDAAASLFMQHRDFFCFAWQEGRTVFTHAGISQKWFAGDFRGDVSRPIAGQLNHPSGRQLASLFRVGQARGGPKGACGGIFWADASELSDPLHGFMQVVGHNRVKEVTERAGGCDSRIVFCDCLRMGKYWYGEGV